MYEHFDLFTDFEYKGTWWISEKPKDKLYGSLKFKHNNHILLELNGLFEKKSTSQRLKPEIILGITSEGKEVTLFQSYESEFSGPVIDFNSGSDERIGKQNFICKYMFVGEHFNRPEDIVFKYLATDFTYLDQWLNNTLKVDEKTENGYLIKGNPIKSELKIDSMSTTLTIWSNPFLTGTFITGGVVTDGVNIKYNSGIVINPDEPKNLKWFENFVFNLGNLLTLFIGYPVYPTSLHGESIDASDYELVEIYYVVQNPRYIDDLRSHDLDITFPEMNKYPKRNVANVINNWFEKLELLRPVYKLLSITFYDSSMYSRTYFLTLMQGIETFHRRVFENDGKYLDDDKYKPIREAIIGAIPEETESNFKENLIGRSEHLNEFSLRKRLKILKNYGVGDVKYFEMIMGNEPNVINNLVNTRNYHTHFDEKDDQYIFSDDELPRINYKLRLFLRVLLLDQIDSGILDTFGICIRYKTQLYYNKEFQKYLKSE